MIRALVTGTLYGSPEQRTAKSGNLFTTAKLRADGKDGATVWCSLIAFGELAERLATLAANSAVAVSGRAEVNAWLDKQGEPKAGLSIVADELATLKAKPRPPQGTGDTRRNGQGEDAPPRPQHAQRAPVAAGFDDELPEFM